MPRRKRSDSGLRHVHSRHSLDCATRDEEFDRTVGKSRRRGGRALGVTTRTRVVHKTIRGELHSSAGRGLVKGSTDGSHLCGASFSASAKR
eukprot:5985361-Pyramimonas_sp.AAC.1